MPDISFCILIIIVVLNLVGIVFSTVLISRAQDNRIKLLWGAIVLVCSLSMLVDNLEWLGRFIHNYGLGERNYLLIFPRMLKWYSFIHIFSLVPIISLRPGWLNPLRFITLSLPFIFSTLVCLCYICFDGKITPVYSFGGILDNLGILDVQIRAGYFILSMTTPMIYFFVPFAGTWLISKRKPTTMMYFYISSFFLLMVSYLLFILKANDMIFTYYAFLVTFIPDIFTFLYIYKEDPLSYPRVEAEFTQQEKEEYQETVVSPLIYGLHLRMVEVMEKQQPFTNPDYNILQLTKDLNAKRSTLIKAIQYSGFTGFSEYINHLRLEYFKAQAGLYPGMSIKELMYRCGFTSRSSFYRRFTEKEKMSPTEYLEKISQTPRL